jgi:hypothetical protein
MNVPLQNPPIDVLSQVIENARQKIADDSVPVKARVQLLWAYAKAARDLAASDVLQDEFVRLAIETGLISESGRWLPDNVRASVRPYGREDIEHVIRWALHGLNPFEKGPLQ